MKLKTLLFGKTYEFRDLKDVLAKANEEKSGDKLAGIAAESAEERVAAKVVLSEVLLSELREHPVVPYEEDEVTRIIQDDLNERIYNEIKGWTVSQLREWLLDEATTSAQIRRISRGLTSEMIAAVCKLMSNLDLISAAKNHRHRPLQHDHRPAGNALLPLAAEPSDGRHRRHHRLFGRRAELRRGRRSAGAEPGGRQRRERQARAHAL